DLVKRLIEQIAFEARNSELVDKKSGVSARLTISAFENAISAAERRATLHQEEKTFVWISDLIGIIPSITGKVELVYEGEQEGPFQVAMNLLNKAIRTQFILYFPNPDQLKKRKTTSTKSGLEKQPENPFRRIAQWFDKGNILHISFATTDKDKIKLLSKVDGLPELVKKYFNKANAEQTALLMEFVLHGLAAYSLISKNIFDNKIEFKDLMGSIMNFDSADFEEDFDDEN
ncbi:MAG: magnesium chelatase, partial [Chitinophagaceae bacterium]|nr:magnesium chelatase [Chitinophagaceae bacterium]